MKVTAAVLPEPRMKLEIKELELDSPGDNEILVRVVATGISDIDLAAISQALPLPSPIVLGHESAGIIESVGYSIKGFQPGDPVIMTFNSCGTCSNCLAGQPAYCRRFMQLNFLGHREDGSFTMKDGKKHVAASFCSQSSFADHAIAYPRNLVKIPPSFPLDHAGVLGYSFSNGAGIVTHHFKPMAGQGIAVFGTNAQALSAIFTASLLGCEPIIAVDHLDSRLKIAEAWGASHSINNSMSNPWEVIFNEITDGGVDYCLETTGNNETITQAMASLKTGGKCICSAINQAPALEIDNTFCSMGKSLEFVLMANYQPKLFIPALISQFKKEEFSYDSIMKNYPLSAINQAIEDMQNGSVIKPVIQMPR